MLTRPLDARGDVSVSALGFGCRAIGGPFDPERAAGRRSDSDDAVSAAAIHRGLELGGRLTTGAPLHRRTAHAAGRRCPPFIVPATDDGTGRRMPR